MLLKCQTGILCFKIPVGVQPGLSLFFPEVGS